MIPDFLKSTVNVLFYFLVLGVALSPLEKAFFANKQPLFRKQWLTDFSFYALQNLLWVNLTLFCLTFAHQNLQFEQTEKLRQSVATWPLAIQIICIILISDLLIYWAHRLSHKSNFLWRFHRVHHTPVTMDWAAAFREHPLDNVYTRLIVNLPALFLGFPLETIAVFIVFRGLWGNFIHSNTRFGLGPFKYILGSPRLHHWHHDLHKNSNCNFANLMPLMDLLFGTFYDPGKFPEKYGVPEKLSHHYLIQMATPFLPRKIASRLNGYFNEKRN